MATDNTRDTRTVRQALKASRLGELTPIKVKNPDKYLHSSAAKRAAR